VSAISVLKPSVGITCCCCGLFFEICKSCWRNQKYCTGKCARNSRLLKQRSHQSKYRKTEKGIKAQTRANRRYRLHLTGIVSERTSTGRLFLVSSFEKKKICQCCFQKTALLTVLDLKDHRYFSFYRFNNRSEGDLDG